MSSDLVCTLFELDYHHGVAALVNSLCRNGFAGKVYAGYRGELPPWALAATPLRGGGENDTAILTVTSQVEIHFVPVKTSFHLANLKPEFMLRVWALNEGADLMYYFDPDIVICEEWNYFHRWASKGVAVCEDWNSPLARYHPRRLYWRDYFRGYGFKLRPGESYYVNSGLVGIPNSLRSFLSLWKSMLEFVGLAVGGLENSATGRRTKGAPHKSLACPFSNPDQDALNAACEVTEGVVSVMNKNAMGWGYGHCVAAHAIGKWKPWSKTFLNEALRGTAPVIADKLYWRADQVPLRSHSVGLVQRKRLELLLARIIAALISSPKSP
jgi:hypothetical protein